MKSLDKLSLDIMSRDKSFSSDDNCNGGNSSKKFVFRICVSKIVKAETELLISLPAAAREGKKKEQ